MKYRKRRKTRGERRNEKSQSASDFVGEMKSRRQVKDDEDKDGLQNEKNKHHRLTRPFL